MSRQLASLKSRRCGQKSGKRGQGRLADKRRTQNVWLGGPQKPQIGAPTSGWQKIGCLGLRGKERPRKARKKEIPSRRANTTHRAYIREKEKVGHSVPPRSNSSPLFVFLKSSIYHPRGPGFLLERGGRTSIPQIQISRKRNNTGSVFTKRLSRISVPPRGNITR